MERIYDAVDRKKLNEAAAAVTGTTPESLAPLADNTIVTILNNNGINVDDILSPEAEDVETMSEEEFEENVQREAEAAINGNPEEPVATAETPAPATDNAPVNEDDEIAREVNGMGDAEVEEAQPIATVTDPEEENTNNRGKKVGRIVKAAILGVIIIGGIIYIVSCCKRNKKDGDTKPTSTSTPTTIEKQITNEPTQAPTYTPTLVPTDYPDDYFEYDDDEVIYDGSLVDGYDPSKFVVGPDGKLYTSQEDVDKIFGKQPADVNAPFTFEGETYINYIVYLQFRCDMIEVEYNEDHILVPKQNTKTNCK